MLIMSTMNRYTYPVSVALRWSTNGGGVNRSPSPVTAAVHVMQLKRFMSRP